MSSIASAPACHMASAVALEPGPTIRRPDVPRSGVELDGPSPSGRGMSTADVRAHLPESAIARALHARPLRNARTDLDLPLPPPPPPTGSPPLKRIQVPSQGRLPTIREREEREEREGTDAGCSSKGFARRASAKGPHTPRTALVRRVEQAKQADSARRALLEKQDQDGLAKAMDYVEAELGKPMAFGEKARGTIGRMAHGIGALLLRCFGQDLR